MKSSIVILSVMFSWRSVLRVSHAWTTSRATHRLPSSQLFMSSTASRTTTKRTANNNNNEDNSSKMINLHTIPQEELETILKSWGQPKYRAKQIMNWVRVQGVTNVDDMNNIPKKLKVQLKEHAAVGTLMLDCELISKDGTQKRAYRLHDGQLIESVLMPYQDGRYTACISSQAGCAQGCVFCATGQMGFSRQLTPEEIFEQVARFSSELAQKEQQGKKSGQTPEKTTGRSTRLSNIVFMGMGEPLANYRNVVKAVKRIQSELGIGHRKITISTVGIVPNIAKLAKDLPQVRLAVSLHCANDKERSELLPANTRYGGLDELMKTLQYYIETTGKRITLEWALIELENDTPETARQLGKLIKKWLRRDMVHVNVIPLNPTGGYGGSPSGRQRVNTFVNILKEEYGVACTPRVRRGIDINAGCGQLKAEVEKRERESQRKAMQKEEVITKEGETVQLNTNMEFIMDKSPVTMSDEEDWEDYEYQSKDEKEEAARLLSLVKETVITADNGVVGGPSTK